MEYTNLMKNGIRMIYGMMIMLTLLILVSIVIDAKTTPEVRDPVMQSPANPNPNPPTAVDAGNRNDESGESGVGGVGEGRVTQIPIEKRDEAPKDIKERATAYIMTLLGENGEKYVNQYITYKESYLEKVYVGTSIDILNPSLPDLPEDGKASDVGAVGDLVDAREMTNAEKAKLEEEKLLADCTSWFDGCNTCEVVNGQIRACTKKQCVNYKEPRCLAYANEKPTATKGADTDVQGAPVQREDVIESEWWVIVYDYNFEVQGPVDPMARIIRVYLDKNDKIVRYEGPEEPYRFELGVDEVKNIARKAGMKTPNEAFIRPGWMGWLADESIVLGDEKESILWQVVSNNPEVGTPEIVYIHPDTGGVLGILTKQEEQYLVFGGLSVPLPEGADSQQKAASATSRMNEKVKEKLARLRSRVPQVDEEKMKRFIEKAEEKQGEGKKGTIAYFFSRIASFFAAIF